VKADNRPRCDTCLELHLRLRRRRFPAVNHISAGERLRQDADKDEERLGDCTAAYNERSKPWELWAS
ncbi:unnamed protein product, partial [Effrenium voratum]